MEEELGKSAYIGYCMAMGFVGDEAMFAKAWDMNETIHPGWHAAAERVRKALEGSSCITS